MQIAKFLHFLGLLLLLTAGSAQAALLTPLTCTSDGSIFNTAFNGNPTGAPKASGSTDNVWEIGVQAPDTTPPDTTPVYGLSPPTTWAAATVSNPHTGWTARFPGTGAGWISFRTDSQTTTMHTGNVEFWLRYQFTLAPEVIPSTFRLVMDFYADNSVGEIRVNGVSQTVTGVPDADPYNSQHFKTGTALSATLTNNWQTGLNTLMVRISSGQPAIGYLAKNSASALCNSYVTVSKVTQGAAGGPFTITGVAPNANGFVGQNITTAVAGTAVSAAKQTLTMPGVITDIQESAPIAGYALSGISCTGLGAGGTATPNLTNAAVGGVPARSVRLNALATASGSNIACTFVNDQVPTIQFAKVLADTRVATNDQFTVAIRTGGVSGTVVNSTTNSTTTGSGATVTAGTGATGIFSAATGTAYTLTEAAAGGANLANYSGTLSCVDTAGIQTGLPSGEAFNPALGRTITPVAGAALSCTLTNAHAPKVTLQKAIGGLGRLAASDQFTVDIRTGGVSGTVVNSTANSTTLGIGASVTAGSGSTGVYTGIAGTAYTLNEAMAAGSASTLAKYIRTLSCTNVGGTTNVSSFSSLPLTFSPVSGDNVLCTVTNTPAGASITGRVFLDNGVSSGIANDGLINGGEAGLSGITVRLTNCAATVYASGVTDGTGAYNLAVPTGTATGAALCVEQTNQGTRISTGASVDSTALPSGTATPVASTTYTYTRTSTPDRIAFTYNGTGHSDSEFRRCGYGHLRHQRFQIRTARHHGKLSAHLHRRHGRQREFCNFSRHPAPTLTGWSEKIFADPGCTGTLQAGAAQLYPPAAAATTVVFGQKVCVIMQEFIPGTAQMSYSNDATVQANFSYSNASPALATASYTLHDITNVGNGTLELKKEVRNVTQGVLTFGINNLAKSGETLEYRISYTNNAATPISNLMVNDTTPVYTSFVASSTGTTPATLTACTKNTPFNPLPQPAVSCATAQTAGSTGSVSWKFTGSLSPSGTGEVLFQVKVD